MAEKKNHKETGVSRRDLFQIIGSAPILAAVTGGAALAAGQEHQHEMQPEQTGEKAPYQRKIFNDQQWRTVCVLCDLIVPADERSGSATQAGVPEFMDDWIAFRNEEDGNEDLQAQIFGGLMWLDQMSNQQFEKSFADASPDQQKQILDRIAWPAKAAKEDHAWVIFFNRFRDLTVSGFFSSKMGVADLPYLGNTIVTNWVGCPPNVWTIIEERMKTGYKGVAMQTSPPILS